MYGPGSTMPPSTSSNTCSRSRPRSRFRCCASIPSIRHCGGLHGSSAWSRATSGRRTANCRSGSRSEEHTSELQSPCNLVCRLLLEKKKNTYLQSTLLIMIPLLLFLSLCRELATSTSSSTRKHSTQKVDMLVLHRAALVVPVVICHL